MYFEDIQIGKPWSSKKRLHWFFNQTAQGQVRDYQDDVVLPMHTLAKRPNFNLVQYGHLTINGPRYPLLAMVVGDLSNNKPNALITAGIHGYEPSMVHAVREFLEDEAEEYSQHANIVVPLCISPWAYEFDHRWNPFAEDVNRFYAEGLEGYCEEAYCAMQFIEEFKQKFAIAVDGHETPLRDIELRKSRASRFGTELEDYWQHVPQGYYQMLTEVNDPVIMDERRILAESITDAVKQFTPIAPEPKLLSYHNDNGTAWAPNKGSVYRVFAEKHAAHTVVSEVFPDKIGAKAAIEVQKQVIRTSLKFI